MKQNRLSFESENLLVDYISFNIEGFIDTEPIARSLLPFGFNSTITEVIEDRKLKSRFSNFRNKYQVYIQQYHYNPEYESYWEGTKINFSDKNAFYLYNLIKAQKFDWRIFEFEHHTLSLSRFDLCYY